MKKFLLMLGFAIFICICSNTKVHAIEYGTCIIQHASNTYEVETPFYWYTVEKESKVNSMLNNTTTYNSTEKYIDTKLKCENISGSTQKIITDESNILNTTYKTFYYSKTKITDNKKLYEFGYNMFFKTNMSVPITTTFLSLDDLPPVITQSNASLTIVTTVENIINVNYLKSKITAHDEIDGIIPITIYEDNYTQNCQTIGTYTITFSACDSASNAAYITFIIEVKDLTKPVINGNTNLISNMSNPLTLSQIKDSLTVTDNYYTIPSSSIMLLTDNYTSNEQKEGTFTISLQVTDPSNNTSDEFIINVTTHDDIPPTIEGDRSYEIGYKTPLDLTQILNNLNSKDNIDSSPKIQISKDTYTDYYYTIGIYQVTFIAKDKNNNTSEPFTININVKDLTKPTIYISQKFIGVDSNAPIDINDIIEIIESNNNVSIDNLSVFSIIKDEYSQNKNISGKYTIELYYEYENGDNINIQTTVVVDSYSNTTKETTKSTPKKNFWSTIKNILMNLWFYIKSIFSFKWLKELI